MPDFFELLKRQISKEYGPKNLSAQQLEAKAKAKDIPFSRTPIGPPGPPEPLGPIGPPGPPSTPLDQELYNAGLERTAIRRTLEDYAKDILANYDQFDTLPLGDLFEKVPLGSGFYSRLIDSYIQGTDLLDEGDHQRAVEAFGAPAMTPNLQELILQSLLKSYLSDREDVQQQAAMTGFQVPGSMRMPISTATIGPAQPGSYWDAQAVGARGAAPGQELVTNVANFIAPGVEAARAYYQNRPPTAPNMAPTALPTPTTNISGPTSTLGGTDLEDIQPQSSRAPATNSQNVVRIEVDESSGFKTYNIIAKRTGNRLGYYDEKGKAVYTGDGEGDLADARESRMFPQAEIQAATTGLSAPLKELVEAQTAATRANTEKMVAEKQIAYQEGTLSLARAKAEIDALAAGDAHQQAQIALEAAKLNLALAPLTRQLTELQVATAKADADFNAQVRPIQLALAESQLADSKAARQQREQEQIRRKNMDTFAAQFFPGLVHALAPGGNQPPLYFNQLARGAGTTTDDPAAQAALAVLQNNLRLPEGEQ